MSTMMKVCIVLFDRVDDSNLTGCAQVFASCNRASGQDLYELIFVSVDGASVSTESGIQISATHSVSGLETFDIIVLPAGSGIIEASEDSTLTNWLRSQIGKEFSVISLCRGAKLAEMLVPDENMEFTTHADAVEVMSWAVSNGTLVSNVVYKDNGKVIAACGLLGPFEAALHLVARDHGANFAKDVSNSLEYGWTGPDENKPLLRP